MKVLKFGGTSVGTVNSLTAVKNIVESQQQPVIVVVSALGGLTDNLINTARLAADGNDAYIVNLDAMLARHVEIIRALVPDHKQEQCIETIAGLFEQLKRNYEGVFLLRNLSERTLDVIVSFGERMSSVIVAEIIDGARRFDSMDFVKTEAWFNKNIADQKLTTANIQSTFDGFTGCAIVPGFISTDRESGRITNLGRGGSDFTAALIAAALDAELLEIWTDVDGFMTADPRIVKEAKIVPHMTFVESMELCTFGAKVIYPPTIYPVFHKNIPIKILNTFNPTAPGTLITDNRIDTDMAFKGVSALKATTMFLLEPKSSLDIADLSKRTFDALTKKGLTVNPLVNNAQPNAITFAVADADSVAASQILEKEFAPELNKGTLRIDSVSEMATFAVVGEKMNRNEFLHSKLTALLADNGIEIKGCSDGTSQTTFTIVAPAVHSDQILKLIHKTIFK